MNQSFENDGAIDYAIRWVSGLSHPVLMLRKDGLKLGVAEVKYSIYFEFKYFENNLSHAQFVE